MSTYYCIKVKQSSYNGAVVKVSGSKVVHVSSIGFHNLNSLKNYVSDKQNINFLLFETDFIKSSISLKRSISDRSSINGMVSAKLHKEHSNIDKIVFKYSISEDNPKKETIKYSIHGIYKDTNLYTLLDGLDIYKNTNIISLENYALYALSKKLLIDSNFISVYVEHGSIITVAGNQNELYFSRNEYLSSADDSLLLTEIVKNITYVKQKVRELKFDVVSVNGIVFGNESFITNIETQVNIPVVSLKPTVEICSTDIMDRTFNEYLIEIGSSFINNDLDFTSHSIKSHQQYNQLLNVYIPILVILLVYFGNDAINKYVDYSDKRDSYKALFSDMTQLYPELQKNYDGSKGIDTILNVLKENGNANLVKHLSQIKNDVETINNKKIGIYINADFKGFTWKQDEIGSLTLKENVKFESLNRLNDFKTHIEKLKEELKDTVKMDIVYDLKNIAVDLTFVFSGEKI